MGIIERQYKSNKSTPRKCSFCDEEKKFLMMKPVAMSINGEILVSVNVTSETQWICLECLTLDLDASGYSVDIYEYE